MVGLLWQRDRDDESLNTTLTHACRRYAARFGRWPTVAFVPEGTATDSVVLAVGGKSYTVELRPTRRVPANHVLVGIEGHDPSAPPTSRRAEDGAAPDKASRRAGAAARPGTTSSADDATETENVAAPVKGAPAPTEAENVLAPSKGAPRRSGKKPATSSGTDRKRASKAKDDARAPSPRPEAAKEPARRPVKRRSTMGWDPATARDSGTDDHEAEQLSLWQTSSRDDPNDRA